MDFNHFLAKLIFLELYLILKFNGIIKINILNKNLCINLGVHKNR